MFNILLIKGSPRKESNSNLLMEKALTGVKEKRKIKDIKVKKISPHKLKIKPCISCAHCHTDGICIYHDDMQRIFTFFNQADLVLVSTPVFFNGLPAQFKAMIDRCQAIWASKYKANNSLIDRKKKRTGFLFITGGAPPYQDQFLAVRKIIEMFFRAINTDYRGDLLVSNSDEISVKQRPDLLSKAYQIGKNLV